MKRKLLAAALFALVAMVAYAQKDSTKVKKKRVYDYIAVNGSVADGFTKAAIPDVKVILMRADSTVIDTMKVWKDERYSYRIGKTGYRTRYYFHVKREAAKYILKAEHPNYETTYVDYNQKSMGRRVDYLEGPTIYMKRSSRRSSLGDEKLLNEVTVTATKIKMVWRGDTLVYNADAFNVPEGSMLDGLIKQLPGVELKDNGEILVNGKKIDNLTLNGKDFFKGKNKIMLDNLPYFTVKRVEVYKKQTEENKYLGIDDEDKKEYTMDVVLKREYSKGASANLEAGGSVGPSKGGDWRYKMKGFGLHFSDRTRAVLFGGLNNVNESMEYRGEENYNDNRQQSGDRHFRQVGGQFVYMDPEDKLESSTEVNTTWSDERALNRSRSETFLNDARSYTQSEYNNRSRASNFSLNNTLRVTGKYRFYSSTSVNYMPERYENNGWNVTTADALMRDSINSTWSKSNSKNNTLSAYGYGQLQKRLKTGDSFSWDYNANYYQQFSPESTSQTLYTFHNMGTKDWRDRLSKSPGHSYTLKTNLTYRYTLAHRLDINPKVGVALDEDKSSSHEYLRDSVDYLFDAQNSYDQRTKKMSANAGVEFSYHKGLRSRSGWASLYLDGEFRTDFQRHCMNYESQPLTTKLTRDYTLWFPSASIYYNKQDTLSHLYHSVSAHYSVWNNTPYVTELIDRPISSDPLYVFLGNPDLKSSMSHTMDCEYSLRFDSINQTMRVQFDGYIQRNATTQGYTYDMQTGVRTYRPENISGGNWFARMTLNWNRAMNKKKEWYIGNDFSVQYEKNTSLAITTGSTSAELSKVGNIILEYKPSMRFQKGNLTFSLNGNVKYRNIHRNITLGEQPTDIWDIGYGLNGNYKLPWNFTIETDMTMHMRRGYTDSQMNDNRIYWDATLTKSFHQGQWLLKLRGYDLLSQVSSLNCYVNSQGRTETWTNSMRRYALLTVSYRFSKKPKKDNNSLEEE